MSIMRWMRPTPYISVSGVMPQDGEELLAKIGISSVLNRQWPMDFPLTPRGHLLALGILTSRKTLYGEGNKYPLRYPQKDALELAAAPPEVPVLNVLHHFQEEDVGRVDAVRDAIALVERSGKRVHAVQVNSTEWPMPSTIANIARLGRRVILQVRTHWYKSGRDLARWMQQYAWVVDDVLLGGKVAAAFGLDFRRHLHEEGVLLVGTKQAKRRVLVIPHPSGRSREWNTAGTAERVREGIQKLRSAAPG